MRLARNVVRDVAYENPGLQEALPSFAALELPDRAGSVFASTGGWDGADGITCEFLTSLRAEEDVLAELLAALSFYQADPEIEVYDGRPILPGSRLDHLLLTAVRPGAAEPLGALHPLGRHVDLLWAVPVAAGEAVAVRDRGADAAVASLAGVDIDDPRRDPARPS